MIIVVSDVHLGYDKCNKMAFNGFLDEVAKCDVDDVVLLGDILEFWRRNNVSVAFENEDILTKLQRLNTRLHYVVGNHDNAILKLSERFPQFYPFDVSKYLRLKSGGSEFYFTHGYELDVLANLEPMTIEAYEQVSESLCQLTEAFFGSILSSLWSTLHVTFKRGEELEARIASIIKPPQERREMDRIEQFATSKIKNIFLGLKEDEKLIFGHTHRPFQNQEVANPGSWVSDAIEQNTYIEIEDGKMKLKKFEQSS